MSFLIRASMRTLLENFGGALRGALAPNFSLTPPAFALMSEATPQRLNALNGRDLLARWHKRLPIRHCTRDFSPS
jgi:hypothetical protein